MKTLNDKINEYLVLEAAAKNVHNPRKGSFLYFLKEGDTKAVKIKIANSTKVKDGWYGKSGGYDINIELADNEYKLSGWTEAHYGSGFDYSDDKYQVKMFTLCDKDGKSAIYYVGVSKEAIQEFIRAKGSNKLESILKEIETKEKELAELMQEKQRAEAEVNLEINESLNQ